MNSQHRTKGFASLFILLMLASGALSPCAAFAQQKSRPAPRTAQPPARQTDKAAARRAEAVNLLLETANSARGFKDLLYRAKVQALAADALWPFDEARARQIFARAWEAAAASDREEERIAEEETGIFSNSEEVRLTTARDEVLSKAALRDTRLGETFLRELTEERERAEGSKTKESNRRTPWREISPSGARRLALGYEFLNSKELLRAAAIVEPLLAEGVSGALMAFILRLHASMGEGQTDPYRLYSRLLERAAANPQTDANDLLLLSSYLVSPQLLMVVDEKGGLQFRSLPVAPSGKNRNQTESAAVKSFYSLAVNVLLQRSTASGRTINPIQDRVARYVATGRLLPLFEQAGPEFAQFVPPLRAQLSQLSGEMEAGRGDSLKAQFELTSLGSKNAADPLAPQLEQLNRANGNFERDRILLGIVRKAARSMLWDRAQRSAYQIEDGDMKRAALNYIVVRQIADIARAYRDDKEDDFEAVARFVRRADAPPFASAWGLAQAAVIAARKKENRDQVSALLSEAESYAARADKDSRQRAAAYAAITDAATRVEPQRAWDFLAELVRAANSTPDYTGDEMEIPTSADTPEGSDWREDLSIEAHAFRLDRIFATMARIDFDKTLAQAQALTGEIPRAHARIAAARAELEKK